MQVYPDLGGVQSVCWRTQKLLEENKILEHLSAIAGHRAQAFWTGTGTNEKKRTETRLVENGRKFANASDHHMQCGDRMVLCMQNPGQTQHTFDSACRETEQIPISMSLRRRNSGFEKPKLKWRDQQHQSLMKEEGRTAINGSSLRCLRKIFFARTSEYFEVFVLIERQRERKNVGTSFGSNCSEASTIPGNEG